MKHIFEDPIVKLYRQYLIPTIIAILSNSLYCLVDVYFIAKGAGDNGLAALNIVMPMYTFYSSIGLIFAVGASTIMAIAQGNKDMQLRNRVFTLCVKSLLGIGFLIMIIGLIFRNQLAYILGANEVILNDVLLYLTPVHTASVAFILVYALPLILRSDHQPKLAMQAMLVGNIGNIILDYVFVIPLNMGILGASLATAIAPFLTLLWASTYFIKKKNTLHFVRGSIDISLWFRMVKNGFGSGIMDLSAGLVIFVFNLVILKISNEAMLAAFAIITNIAYVCKGLFNGFSQAAQPIIAANYGANLNVRVKESLQVCLRYSIVFACSLYLLFLLFPKPIAAMFANGNQELVDLSATGLKLYFLCLLPMAINTVYMYYFQSIEKANFAILLAVLKGIVFVCIGIFLFVPSLNTTGVWICVAFAETCACAIAISMKYKLESKCVCE